MSLLNIISTLHFIKSSKSTSHLQALKEKTELQAQLATVSAQLQAQVEQTNASQERQSSLTSEVTTLRSNCSTLEKAMVDLQASLEGKNASLSSLGNDLQVAEEQYQRLMGKVEEMQRSLNTKDNTGEDEVIDSDAGHTHVSICSFLICSFT